MIFQFQGQAFINHFNLGRYWPTMGPQVTLFTPAPALKTGANDIFLVELESPDCRNGVCTLTFKDIPYIDKKPAGSRMAENRMDMLNDEWRN